MFGHTVWESEVVVVVEYFFLFQVIGCLLEMVGFRVVSQVFLWMP